MPTPEEKKEAARRQVTLFCERLSVAPPASSDTAALALLGSVMRAVGDELTQDPYDPTCWKEHLRIYPPEADREVVPSGIEGARLFKTLGDDVIIGLNGAILIRSRTTLVIRFSKAGADGKEVTT